LLAEGRVGNVTFPRKVHADTVGTRAAGNGLSPAVYFI